MKRLIRFALSQRVFTLLLALLIVGMKLKFD